MQPAKRTGELGKTHLGSLFFRLHPLGSPYSIIHTHIQTQMGSFVSLRRRYTYI
jgi:hypothetical protein